MKEIEESLLYKVELLNKEFLLEFIRREADKEGEGLFLMSYLMFITLKEKDNHKFFNEVLQIANKVNQDEHCSLTIKNWADIKANIRWLVNSFMFETM